MSEQGVKINNKDGRCAEEINVKKNCFKIVINRKEKLITNKQIRNNINMFIKGNSYTG